MLLGNPLSKGNIKAHWESFYKRTAAVTGIPGLRQMMEWGHESRIRYKLYLLHYLAQVCSQGEF